MRDVVDLPGEPDKTDPECVMRVFADLESEEKLAVLRKYCESTSKNLRGDIHPVFRRAYRSGASSEDMGYMVALYREQFIKATVGALGLHEAFPAGIPEEFKDAVEMSISQDIRFLTSDASSGAASSSASIAPAWAGEAQIESPTPRPSRPALCVAPRALVKVRRGRKKAGDRRVGPMAWRSPRRRFVQGFVTDAPAQACGAAFAGFTVSLRWGLVRLLLPLHGGGKKH